MQLLTQMGPATLRVKLPGGGERILDAKVYNGELAMMVVASAGDAGAAVVDYGSTGHSGWIIKVGDKFDSPGGHVVILQIVLQKVVTQSRQKQTRPRTPSRSPKRCGPSGRGGRRVFGPDDSKKVGEERSGGYRSGPHESQKCEGTAPGDQAFSLPGTSSFDRQVQGSGGRLDLDVQFGSSFSPNVSDKIREDPPGKVQTNSFGESGEVGASPTIPFALEPATLQPDFSQEVEQEEDQMRAEWQRVVSHVVEVNRTYRKLDRVFSLDGMSWVAVHEQYNS